MSGVLNDCDALLQAADVRILNPDSAFINLSASAPGFHMTGTGTVDLATVTITADLVALDGDVTFAGQGVTLSNVKARSVDATYVNGTGIVTATVVTNGETFKRSYVIPVLRDGAAGAAGQPVYTWIKYADTAAGAGLSDDPAGKAYIGLAHNKSTATESTTPGDYTWALMKGGDGLPGAKGADGITYYTWIKYADQADGTGLYDVPNANTLYIGIAVNRTTATESTTKTDYVWSRFKGEQGVAGAPTYTWIKYADTAAGVGLSDDPTGKTYIGFAYNKSTATESTTAADYTWSLIKGTDGQPGGKGADGATLYTWIKYADVADGTGLYDTPTASTLYIGIATNKSTATESAVKTDYVWSKFKGDQGVQGPTTYTWVKYADSAAGAGLSDDPTGKAYIGFAYNKTTATESTTATDYTWSLIKGTDGQPGGKGADGQTLYTWIKYSDNSDGTGLYDLPTASTQYLGIAVNKTTATESTAKTDYVWSKFRGADGVGTAGARGAGHYYVAGSSWSDVVAQAACPGGPVTNDVVTISSGTFVMEKRWTGSAWVDNGVVINGKLIVPDSILASAIDTRGLVIRDAQGNIVVSAGGLQPGFEAPGTKNSELAPSIASAAGVVLIPNNTVVVSGNRASKPTGANAWDSQVRSRDSYLGGAFATAVADNLCGVMFGLNADHDTDASFTSLDHAIFLRADGTLGAYESNSDKGTIGNYVVGDVLGVFYDGMVVRYCRNGSVLLTTTPARITQPLFFDSSFHSVGSSLSSIRFGPMSDVSAGVSANNALPGINTAIADKLSKSAANILAGAGALVSGSLTFDANGYRTGGYGTAQTQRGWVAYNSSGVLTFQLDAAGGNPYFAGQISGAYGSFGAVEIAVGGYLRQGATGYYQGTGIWMGTADGVPKMHIGNPAGSCIYWNGTELVAQNVRNDKPAFTASLSGAGITSSGANGLRSLGSRQITGSNGVTPYRSFLWIVTDLEGNSAARITISGETTDTVTVSGSGTNASARVRITGIIVDATGATASASFTTTANFGTV